MPSNPPTPAGMTPFRWWVARVTSPGQQVRFLCTPPHALDDLDVIQMYDQEGYDVGYFAWRTCDECRRGYIVKISISPEFQRSGYGRRLVQRALRDGSDYAWSTSGQSPDARRFFPVMSAETGAAFT